jgi:hypothetical protein
MKRKSVGYFEGTDAAVLTSLICDGCDTIPISNGFDNHGRYIRLINEENKPDLIMGYLHKIYSPEVAETRFEDIAHICTTYRMPFLVLVPKALHDCAHKKLNEPHELFQFVDPAEALAAARKILKGGSRSKPLSSAPRAAPARSARSKSPKR